jgi:hypothetical protein
MGSLIRRTRLIGELGLLTPVLLAITVAKAQRHRQRPRY